MSQLNGSEEIKPKGVGLTLALVLLMMVGGVGLFMLYSHLPKDPVSSVGEVATPTVGAINPVARLDLRKEVTVDGIQVTISQVQQAAGFTDQRKTAARYTIRVNVQTQNPGKEPIGINLSERALLVFPNGKTIKPQLISVAPVTMPKETLVGYMDFPTPDPTDLGTLVLRIDNVNVPFSGK